jgi:hypothetical protein
MPSLAATNLFRLCCWNLVLHSSVLQAVSPLVVNLPQWSDADTDARFINSSGRHDASKATSSERHRTRRRVELHSARMGSWTVRPTLHYESNKRDQYCVRILYRLVKIMLTLKLVGLGPANRSSNFWRTTVGEPYTSIKLAATHLCSSGNLSPMASVYPQEKSNPVMLT